MSATTGPPGPASDADRDDTADRSPGRGTDGWADRCRPHIDALWVLASISTSGPTAAEHAVVAAVTAAVDDPAGRAAGPASVWAVLVRHLELATARSTHPWMQGDGPTAAERQTVALVLVGRRPSDVAAFLGVPLGQVHRTLRSGLRALRHTLIDHHPGRVAPGAPGPAGLQRAR